MGNNNNRIVGKVVAEDWIAENNGYPEVGTFEDKKVLQKFYKQLDTDILEDWCSIEGLEYKPCPDSEQIHRMRVAMAILYHHFPKVSKSTKKESKYKKYTTEELLQLAIDNEVPVEETGSEPIMRMRTIMALRAAKVLE
jgi:hypothetical protein